MGDLCMADRRLALVEPTTERSGMLNLLSSLACRTRVLRIYSIHRPLPCPLQDVEKKRSELEEWRNAPNNPTAERRRVVQLPPTRPQQPGPGKRAKTKHSSSASPPPRSSASSPARTCSFSLNMLNVRFSASPQPAASVSPALGDQSDEENFEEDGPIAGSLAGGHMDSQGPHQW
uniref:Uncharacterized protein n=1 Tax=Eutreptiella gymnastica TaxID=73025 RepID=A0A7S1ID04_9EUGL|mmetsp:Transcript_148400/g.259366  ORF Transcript_148400/g.259366 Transcript_148400/m.259366 type:complete len:175 (+) Transcript_148400:77-601(+)